MSAAAQTVTTTKPPQKKVKAWAELRRLIPYLRPYKGTTAFGLFTLVLMGLIGAFPPLIIGIITDCLTGAAEPMPNLTAATRATGAGGAWHSVLSPILHFYHPDSRHTLEALCLLLVGVVVLKGIFSFASRWLLISISRDIEFDLRNDLLAHLVRMEPEFYVRNRTGELMSRCTNDLSAVRMVLGPGIMYSANTIVGMAVAIAVMLKLSPLLTLEVLSPVPVVFVVVRYFGTVIHELQAKIQAMLATLSAKAQENLAGIRVVRAYGQEAAEMRSFDEANRQYVGQNIRMIQAWSMFFPALTTIIGFSILFVLWEGSRMVIQGRMSLGALTAFYFFVGLLVFPMVALGFVTNIFQRGAASMGRLNYILDAKPGISDATAQRTEDAAIKGEIEFRDLTFTYPTTRSGNGMQPTKSAGTNEPVLRNINLQIPAGSTVAIVGPTGSGKTTLAALIARLWEAPPDTLFIDGRSIREWPLGELRKAIGFVPQDAFLFSETIRENIAFGVDDSKHERRGRRRADRERLGRYFGFSAALRNAGRGARHYSFRGPKAADHAGAGVDPRPADPDSGRRLLERRYGHGRKDSARPRRRDEEAHDGTDFPSLFDGPRCGTDHRAARRADHRTRHARRTDRSRRLLRGTVSEAAAGRRIGQRMSDHHEEEKLGRIYDAQLTRRLLQYLKPYKWRVFLAIGLTIIVTPLQLVGPKLFADVIDHDITPALGHKIAASVAFHGILWISLAFMATLILLFAFQYGQVRIMQSVGQQTMYDLRKQIFGHLQRLPMGFFDRTPVGRLVTRVTTDVDALNDLFAAGVVAMVNDLCFLVAAVAYMLKLNWRLAFAAFAVLPLMLGVTWIFRNSVRDANRRIRTAIARINAFLQEHISGMAIDPAL